MLIEPLTLPVPIERDLQRYYGLPSILPVDAMHPHEGWNVISPTVALTLGLPFKPWYAAIPPTERVGILWLYCVPGKKAACP